MRVCGHSMIAEWEQSRYLCVSSFLLMGPSIYGFSRNLVAIPALLTLTSLVSANYWRQAEPGIRRNTDLIVAKISFVTLVSNGIYYVKTDAMGALGYVGLAAILYCFYKSCKMQDGWVIYHVLFHTGMMIEQFLIIYFILA